MIHNWKHPITIIIIQIPESAFAGWDMNSAAPGVGNASYGPRAELHAPSILFQVVMISSNSTKTPEPSGSHLLLEQASFEAIELE